MKYRKFIKGYQFTYVEESKKSIIKKVISKYFGYILVEEYYSKLLYSENRSHVLDNLLCKYTKDKFIIENCMNNKINTKNNLHRWCLLNRDKTKYEKNYPW